MLKSYEELRKLDVTPYCKSRDGIPYLNWAKCIDLLRENGAETVYFEPVVNSNGSSLFSADKVFTDKNNNTNSCYEVEVEIHIDDKIFNMRQPLMNGGNPVKDNSLTQQRVWNAQTRAFVKGVAIHTGLGFDLWVQSEASEDDVKEENIEIHNILKIKERINEKITTLMMSKEMSLEEIAEKCNTTKDELEAVIKTYFTKIYNLEGYLGKLL